MKIFSRLYESMLKWSGHKYAPYYLAAVSFAESSFFPIPPDVMLVSMGLAKPRSALQNAMIATIFSVLGGAFGYLLGFFFIHSIEPYIINSAYAAMYQNIHVWFKAWGIWIIFIAGFTPIPYKLFTITAGAMHMLFLPFIAASFVGRGLRFFLVSAILYIFGDRFETYFRRWVDWVGYLVLIIICAYLLVGCGIREGGLAPVEESRWHTENLSRKTHVVRRGETLYAIAFRYEKDYMALARANYLKPPYNLRVGQRINLTTGPKIAAVLPELPQLPIISSSSPWIWPTKGQIKTHFAPSHGHKGINIKGQKGQKIRASRPGVVAYSGNGLPGYGNLIIIKHDNQYLTAYGNNQSNLVHEGEKVSQGQVIANMGVVDRAYYGVHFEIRKSGEPVNPLKFLNKKA